MQEFRRIELKICRYPASRMSLIFQMKISTQRTPASEQIIPSKDTITKTYVVRKKLWKFGGIGVIPRGKRRPGQHPSPHITLDVHCDLMPAEAIWGSSRNEGSWPFINKCDWCKWVKIEAHTNQTPPLIEIIANSLHWHVTAHSFSPLRQATALAEADSKDSTTQASLISWINPLIN